MWSWICGENQWREELSGRRTGTIFELTYENSSTSLVLESKELTIVRKCDVSYFRNLECKHCPSLLANSKLKLFTLQKLV